MSIDMEQFHGVFFDESQEHLDEMEHQLMELDLQEPDPEQLNSIFRAAHSIKGGSGIFGFDALTGVTHVMENLLDQARQQTLILSTEIVDLFLHTVDNLKSILAKYRNGESIDDAEVAPMIKDLEEVLAAQSQYSETENNAPLDQGNYDLTSEKPSDVEDDGFGFFEPISSPPQEAETHAKSVDNTADQGFGFFEPLGVENESPKTDDDQGFGFFAPLEQSPKDGLELNEAQSVKSSSIASDINKDKLKPKKAAKRSKPSKAKQSNADTSSIRVDTLKIDSLVNLVGELVITQSMLTMIGSEVEGELQEKIQTALAELHRNTREIQESVMSMRMLPMQVTFNRFPRVVRDLSSKLGKKVDLRIEGGNTEIDKGMIEKLVDPLTHLVRNSIDHGIETTAKRIELGKPETGVVTLKAEQKGSSIVISIIDDGAGLSRQRILDKAIENGLDVDVTMSDDRVWQLIFEAGFSTAAEVTDVSGRGVGMDVVRRNIESIGGRIEIESTLGAGSEFRIQLPLTLAIVDGMCVGVGDQVFVVPLVNIIESIQPSKEQIKMMSNDKLLWIREQYWPLIDLYDVMNIDNAITEPSKGIVVLLESSKKRFGLLIDGLLGQQQVVIKSLEQHYKRVPGIAGATIMGDGDVAMILDVESLASKVNTRLPEAEL
jgi:two-component system chemotaxis sensor kinase CheA